MYFSPLEFYYEFTLELNKKSTFEEVDKYIDKINYKVRKEIKQSLPVIDCEFVKVEHLYAIYEITNTEHKTKFYIKGLRLKILADQSSYNVLISFRNVVYNIIERVVRSLTDEYTNFLAYNAKDNYTEEEIKRYEELNQQHKQFLKDNDQNFRNKTVEYKHYWS